MDGPFIETVIKGTSPPSTSPSSGSLLSQTNNNNNFDDFQQPFVEEDSSGNMIKGIQQWNSVDVLGTVPWARCWFGTALVGSQMFVFGGYNGKKLNSFLSDLHSLDLETLKWSELHPTGDVPSGRYAFSFTPNHDGSLIYLFGGARGKDYFNDVYVLDTKMLVWTKLRPSGNAPSSRCGHVACMVQNKLFIQGGDGGTGNYLGDMYILDTEKAVFQKVASSSKVAPSPRGWHSVVVLDDKLYFFGGINQSKVGSKLTNIWIFSPDTQQWDLSQTRGRVPIARYSHTTVSAGTDVAVVGGKYNKKGNDIEVFWLNMESLCWWQPNIKGTRPAHRYAHSTLIYKGKMYLFGGFDSTQTFNDLYVLDIETDLQAGNLETPFLPQLSNHLKTLVNSNLFSDITFIVEGKKIFAHRNILVARSVYFSKMLLGQLKESQHDIKEVVVTETQHPTFLNFLMYIYCETISSLDINQALDLLTLANRYQHDQLKRDLSFMIEQYLVVDNCCLLLEYAYHNEARMLATVCLNFIKKNFEAVKRTSAFSSIKHILYEAENKN